MKKLHYLGLMGLLTACTPSLEKRMQQPVTYPGTNAPERLDFDFKPFYDSSEVLQKRGVYYTRLMRYFKNNYGWADTLVEPQKLQEITHIYVRMPDASPVQQHKYARFSVGRFLDGRKDGLWLYAKFVQARLHPDSPIQTLPPRIRPLLKSTTGANCSAVSRGHLIGAHLDAKSS